MHDYDLKGKQRALEDVAFRCTPLAVHAICPLLFPSMTVFCVTVTFLCTTVTVFAVIDRYWLLMFQERAVAVAQDVNDSRLEGAARDMLARCF